jgi:NAD(P)-dependent dehydrogenase (short-subunit alcohol dehydrogenase family)
MAQKRRFISVQAGTRDLAVMKTAAERAIREFGKIDILVVKAAQLKEIILRNRM